MRSPGVAAATIDSCPYGALAQVTIGRDVLPVAAGKRAVLAARGSLKGRYENETMTTTLLRDIFDNPLRPVAFDRVWRTSTAMALAKGMYDSRNFGAMPILADALQDAGCEQEDVLNHCRDEKQTHVRGCWVVDLVLGKV